MQVQSLVREEPTCGRVRQEKKKEEDSLGHQIFVGSTLILLTFLLLDGSEGGHGGLGERGELCGVKTVGLTPVFLFINKSDHGRWHHPGI